jgi:ABC-2 type transport system permease protein
MSPRRSLAISRHEMRILRRDPLPFVLLLALPIAIVAFLKPALALALFVQGHTHATGSEQAVPGMAVTFSFFLVGFVGAVFFREHAWGTWDRLRTEARPAELLVGMFLPIAGVAYAQMGVLFAVGFAGFGLRVRGSVAALALMAAVVPVAAVAYGTLVVAAARTLQQVNVVANLGTVVLAGIGGALIPLPLLPSWARRVAPATPAYWAMRGFRAVILDGRGVGSVLLPIGVLVGFAAVCAATAAARFSLEEAKVSWA